MSSIAKPATRWTLLRRELTVCAVISLGCALFFSTMFREPFGINLVYATCITATIQSLIRAGRYVILRWVAHGGNQGRLAVSGERAWPHWGLMLPWIMISGVLGYAGGHALATLLTGGPDPRLAFLDNPRALMLSMIVVLALSVGITYFHYSRARLAATEARAQAALRSAAQTQLRLLQSQLEPHMLFNTLANLRVLIGQDPQRAQDMLNHVIAFLRATLDASRSGAHPLAAEFARIGDYLALMQIRMGERLRVETELPPALAALPVPPLLLQPLVENAIKHGLEPAVAGGWIRLAARSEAGMLVLTVRDTGVGLGALPPDPGCFGTAQVRERLAHLFGEHAVLELRAAGDDEGGTEAIVRLPLPDASLPDTAPQDARESRQAQGAQDTRGARDASNAGAPQPAQHQPLTHR